MDPDAGTTRDPRLASRSSRPPLNRLSSLPSTSGSPIRVASGSQPSGNISPVDAQNATTDQFIRGVSDLVQAAVIAASSHSEKERLQKRRDTTENLLKKAKSHTSFPSTAAFFQQSQKDEEVDITRVDDALKKHAAHYKQLENALRAKFSSIISSDTPRNEDRLNHLQRDLQSTRTGMGNTNNEISKLRDYNINLEGKMKLLQDRMSTLDKTATSHASTLSAHHKLTKETSERITKITSEIETASASKERQDESAALKTHIDELRTQASDLGVKIRSLQKSQQESSDSFDKASKSMDDHQKKHDSQSMENTRSLAALNARLISLEHKNIQPSPPAEDVTTGLSTMLKKLESRLQKLESDFSTQYKPDPTLGTKLQEMKDEHATLRKIQEMKDDLQFSEMEELKRAWETGAQELEKIQANQTRLEEELKGLIQNQAIPAVVQEQIAGLSTGLRNTQHVVETVRVGLQSFEARYNSLSTDTIVKNMVVAMQEMYPSTAQLTEQISIIRGWFEREIPPMKATVERLQYIYANHREELQKEVALRVEEVARLRREHTNLSQSLAPVWERLAAQNQNRWLTADDMRQLQGDLNALEAKLKEHTSKFDGYLTSMKAEEKLLVQNLNMDRADLHNQLKALADEQGALAKRFNDTRKDGDLQKRVSALADKQEDLLRKYTGSQKENWQSRFQALSDEQKGLAKKENLAKSNLQSQVKALLDEQKTLVERFVDARKDHDQLKALVEAQETLAKRLSEAQASNEGDLKMLKSCPDELKTMLDRVCQLEDATMEKYQGLVEKNKLFENSLSRNHKTLKDSFNDLVRNVQRREPPLQLEAPPQDDNTNTLKCEDEEGAQDVQDVQDAEDEEVQKMMNIAEATPARAPPQNKKKRPRPSTLSDEDRSSLSRNGSPRSNAVASPAGTDATPSTDTRKSRKRKKKNRKGQAGGQGMQAGGTIVID
ncbi:hypothetical protein BO94DRAFT_552898 [Aspergillus sclerotioniger CBS 115572]|uniref:Paramyosin n=1 Tax=Aspergillus sclerotioniger CBS 115572 TaxID=1450535 RepID=A0A317X8N2_9EURO|nr:hypothetical protein BO94DRAFT_552898 [Aspergillus sclerotioniger CBS 115572]PWY94909.1 hypothetical protein BO94DRAFT_552898 [Aspergillus sclerotioniger CBS 115572]